MIKPVVQNLLYAADGTGDVGGGGGIHSDPIHPSHCLYERQHWEIED